MKRLSDIKRRVNSGEVIIMTWHKHQDNSNKRGLIGLERTAEKIQTNAVRFTGGSWLYWGKAKDYKIDSDNEFTVLNDGEPLMSYKFVRAKPEIKSCTQELLNRAIEEEMIRDEIPDHGKD